VEFGKIFSGWQIILLRHTGDFQKTGLLRSFNKGVSALNYIQHQRIQFVAQAVPHQCIAHHGAEHRAAAAAEKTTASASPSRLWIQSCPGQRKGAVRLGNGNESDSSAPTIRLATLIRGARTAAGGERARILGVGAIKVCGH
jgi:hypothetical protein